MVGSIPSHRDEDILTRFSEEGKNPKDSVTNGGVGWNDGRDATQWRRIFL